VDRDQTPDLSWSDLLPQAITDPVAGQRAHKALSERRDQLVATGMDSTGAVELCSSYDAALELLDTLRRASKHRSTHPGWYGEELAAITLFDYTPLKPYAARIASELMTHERRLARR
jgi:hypothetical protein